MAQDGIEFNPLGTVGITIDAKTYTLRRPKLREYRQYRDRIRELSIDAVARLETLRERLEATEGDEQTEVEDEIREVSANSFLLTSIPWLKEVFDALGTPLPDDHDDWPAWLAADQSIPGQIIGHWRTVPLAPGAKGTNSP